MSEIQSQHLNLTLEEALLSLKDSGELKLFLEDLCSKRELESLRERIQVVSLLYEKKTYRQISEELKASTTTVTRVAKCLKQGDKGYALMIKRVHEKRTNSHLSQ